MPTSGGLPRTPGGACDGAVVVFDDRAGAEFAWMNYEIDVVDLSWCHVSMVSINVANSNDQSKPVDLLQKGRQDVTAFQIPEQTC